MKTDPNRRPSPGLSSELRKNSIVIPEVIYQCSGINIMGTRLKSIIFTTDVAIIANNNAQAVLCVYPFTPQLNITTAVLNMARCPVFVGVGGGTTSGQRCIALALQAELLGAYGVVVNAPMKQDMIRELTAVVDIPLIATVGSEEEDIAGKIKAGADILNVSGGPKTVSLVRRIRDTLGEEVPIMATGGPTQDSILATIEAGANAITYTPPSAGDIFHGLMQKYRGELAD